MSVFSFKAVFNQCVCNLCSFYRLSFLTCIQKHQNQMFNLNLWSNLEMKREIGNQKYERYIYLYDSTN